MKQQDKQTVLVCPPFDCLISEQQLNGKRLVNLKISESHHNKSIIQKQKEYIERLITDNQKLISKIKQKDGQIQKLRSVTFDRCQTNGVSNNSNAFDNLNPNILAEENNQLKQQVEKLRILVKQYEYKLCQQYEYKMQRTKRTADLQIGAQLAEQVQFEEQATQMTEVAVQTPTIMFDKLIQSGSIDIEEQLTKIEKQKQRYEHKYTILKKKYTKLKKQMNVPRYLDEVEIQQEEQQYFEVQTQTNFAQKYQNTKQNHNLYLNQSHDEKKKVRGFNQINSNIINAVVGQNNRLSHSSITSQNQQNLSSQNQQKIMELTQLTVKLQEQNISLKRTMQQFKQQLTSYTNQVSNKKALEALQNQNIFKHIQIQRKKDRIEASLLQPVFFQNEQQYSANMFMNFKVLQQNNRIICSQHDKVNIQKPKERQEREINHMSKTIEVNPIFFREQQYRCQTFCNDEALFKQLESLPVDSLTKILKQLQKRLSRWIKQIQKEQKVQQSTLKGIQREVGCKKMIQYMLISKNW